MKKSNQSIIKWVIPSLVLFLSACGVTIVTKNESSESPYPINEINVQFETRPNLSYKIEKYGKAPDKVVITEENKALARSIMSPFVSALRKSIETDLRDNFLKKNITPGKNYKLIIYLDEVKINIQNENAGLKVAPLFNIKYSAILYRNTDNKVLWTVALRRPNGDSSEESVKNLGNEISEKIFSEISKSGWVPK